MESVSNLTPRISTKTLKTPCLLHHCLHTFAPYRDSGVFRINSVRSQVPLRRRKYKRKTPVFREEDAFPMSIPLQKKHPHAIYEDIQRFATKNKLKEALAILDYMDKQGIPVNPTTFSALIAACVRLKSLAAGKQIHTHIRINGLEGNEFLQTKLVHMYSACGSVEDAEKVFAELPSKSVYPWNALLRGNVVSGGRRYVKVLDTFSQMRESGVESNVYTFSCLMKSFAGASALHQGLKTHALLIKNGLLNSQILMTSLIDVYFKCGKVKLARQVLEEMDERDIVVWGTIISGFAHNRLQREAIEYLRWMISEGTCPNSVILTMIIPVIGEIGALNLGRELHAYVIKTKEYSKQVFIQSSLIDMYCKCKDMVSGRGVFYSSMERNAIAWTALMSGYAINGRYEQALRSIIWMQQEGFKPDIVTIATVLPVCEKLGALKQGKEIHGYSLKNGILPNVSVFTSLMMMYSKCGVLKYASKLFDQMPNRNVKSWTAMIESYIRIGHFNEALTVFRSMQLSKHRPDSVTISRILTVCSGLKILKLGKEIHCQILRRDFRFVPFVTSELVKMYGICGETEKAKMAFHQIPVKGSISWTAIIEAYGYNELNLEAINIFNDMVSGDFKPNHYTLTVLLSICGRAGFADDASRIFNLITRRYKVKASEEHFDILIELLDRFGRADEAQRFIQLKSSST